MLFQCGYDFSNSGCLLTDGYIDTDHILALLVNNSICCDRSLTCLSVSYDKLTLSSSDWKHGINRQDSRLHRRVYRFTVYDSRCLLLDWTVVLLLDLAFAIDRLSKCIDDSSNKALTHRYSCLFLCSAHLSAFFNSGILTE